MLNRRTFSLTTIALVMTACATTPPPPVSELAPTGRLRAAINYGNPVLAQRATDGAAPLGISADLARELAKRLGVEITYVEFDGAGFVVDALTQDR